MDRRKLNMLIKMMIAAVILIATILVIVIIKSASDNIYGKNNFASQLVELNWPEEVPMVESSNFDVTGGQDYWNVSIKKGVTFQILRKYLLQLEKAGFEADHSAGSQTPKLLKENVDFTNIHWCGLSELYEINVYWGDLGKTGEFGEVIDYNLDIYLKKINNISSSNKEDNDTMDNPDINSGDEINLNEEELNFSGDLINSNEEGLNYSGDTTNSNEEGLEILEN